MWSASSNVRGEDTMHILVVVAYDEVVDADCARNAEETFAMMRFR